MGKVIRLSSSRRGRFAKLDLGVVLTLLLLFLELVLRRGPGGLCGLDDLVDGFCR